MWWEHKDSFIAKVKLPLHYHSTHKLGETAHNFKVIYLWADFSDQNTWVENSPQEHGLCWHSPRSTILVVKLVIHYLNVLKINGTLFLPPELHFVLVVPQAPSALSLLAWSTCFRFFRLLLVFYVVLPLVSSQCSNPNSPVRIKQVFNLVMWVLT